jgi:hypothetical protein
LSAVVGALVLLCTPRADAQMLQPVTRLASLAPGAIDGLVQDDRGQPVAGAIVSALGTTTAVAVTDKLGRFELRTLTPGPYILRVHLSGYVAPRGQVVEVRSSARTSSLIALRRAGVLPDGAAAGSLPVLAAGIGGPLPDAQPEPEDTVGTAGTAAPRDDTHSELAWRLRHARRGILKDAAIPDEILVKDTPPDANVFGAGSLWSYMGSPARAASSWLAGTAFSGQVNLLTTGSFESPQQLFAPDSFSRGIAYLALGAPVGDRADWTVRAALTQGDISSWILAGEYTTRAPARHRYDFGWSYSTQRYDGGNIAALTEVSDGSRNAGALFGFDTFAITPSMTLTYGGRYARYDYLEHGSLVSPRVSLTVEPFAHFRVSGGLSRRAVAPGAEEFSPRMDNTVWLPPQRTFASIDATQPLQAEHTNHIEVEVERDVAAATLSVRAFRQHITDQQVTLFGIDLPGAASHLGHYFIGNAGDLDATGVSAGIRAAIGGRVHGALEYTTTRAHAAAEEPSYLWIYAPTSVGRELDRIHDVSTSIETDVPETATRVFVLYRIGTGFAPPSPAATSDRPGLQSRFDVQVRQSLPFMDFATTKWEMLVAVRNFFRDAAPDQSVYDELLVVRPPKRVVGGLTLKF